MRKRKHREGKKFAQGDTASVTARVWTLECKSRSSSSCHLYLLRPAGHSCTIIISPKLWHPFTRIAPLLSPLPSTGFGNKNYPRTKEKKGPPGKQTVPWEMKVLCQRAHCAYLLLSGCVPIGPTSVFGCLKISWQLRGVIFPNAAFPLSPRDELCNFRCACL